MNKTKHIHIVACSVFKDAITYLADWIGDRPFSFSYLPSNLHLRPRDLETSLLKSIRTAKAASACTACLYGQCFEDIDHRIAPENVVKIPCNHCYEILLGSRRYQDIMAEEAGTFFVEKDLLLNFDEFCRIPLELDDPELRNMYFQHYQRIVYIRQPLDPDLSQQVQSVANLLDLKSTVVEADYSQLKAFLDQLTGYKKQ